MIFERISLENCGPFLGSWSVDLPEGPTVVVARYEDAETKSNRGGKSFFAVDCPLYALFGEFRGSRVEDFPHRLARGKEDAWVELRVRSSDDRVWTVRRGRTAGGEPIRELDGVRISDADLKRAVEHEILGLSLDEYRLTDAFVQGRMHAFLEMPAAEKRRVVAPWFKTDRWVPRADLAQRRLNGARAALRAVEEREAQAQARIHELSGDDVGAVKMCEEDLDRRRREIEQLEARRAEARADLDRRVEARAKHVAVVRRRDAAKAAAAAERTAAEATLQNARHVLARAVSDLAAARERAARLAGLEASATRLDEVQGALGDLREQAAATQRKATEAEETRRRLLDRYKELERSRTGVCPVLKEACDRVSREAAGLDVLKAEGLTARREGERLTGLAREIAVKVDATLRDLVAVRDAARERQALRDLPSVEEATRVATVAEVAERDAVARLERVRVGDTDAQRALSREQADVDAAVVDLGTEAETRLAEVVNQLDDARRGCKQLETALLDARARLADVQRAREELRDVDALKAELRDRITKLAWAAYAFGAAGIPSRELENAFGVAEDAMNRVLADLRTSLRVRFSPTRELQDWEPACLGCGEPFAKGERTHVCQVCGAARRRRRRDELRLEVEDGGNQSAFELDSGGGQVLLSLGVRLGLASLPGASRRVRCQHVLIDEPDGALDEPNRAAVHGLIRRLGDLGIRQTILVTHADVRREFSSVVTVHRWEDEDRSAVFVE